MDEYRKYEPIFGSWYLKRLIGKGSFGKVFEITREEFGVTYRSALKIISVPQDEDDVKLRMTEGTDIGSVTEYYQDVLKEIVNENEIMSRLKGNSNIVSYEDHQIIPHEDGIGYDILIRMELLTPLLDRMMDRKLDEREVVKLGIDICKALELCHRKNIIHRDIKPQNIFISESGDFKLGDFGIARTIEKTTGGMSKKGTFKYMAPEVFKGEPYDSTADLYSLGIVLYTLLNGNRGPFLPAPPAKVSANDEEAARMRRFRGEPIPAPRDAGTMLSYILQKACEADPARRYRTAEQLRRDLESYLNNYDRQTASFARVPADEGTVIDNDVRRYQDGVYAQQAAAQYTSAQYNDQYGSAQYGDQYNSARYGDQYSSAQYGDQYAGRAYAEPRDITGGGRQKKKMWPVILAAVLGMLLIAGITAGVLKHFSDKKEAQNTEQIVSDEPGEGGEEQGGEPEEGSENKLSSAPEGAVEYNGHYYKVINEGKSWTEAKEACEDLGGHLVTITGSGEQSFVKGLLEEDGLVKKHYWIGANDSESEGSWEWVTGEPFDYSNWDPGDGEGHAAQPNDAGNQDYVEIQTINNTGNNYMTWNDAVENCDNGVNQEGPWYYSKQYFGFICEWE